eukprot:c21234_g1_i2 orf=164-1084(-)
MCILGVAESHWKLFIHMMLSSAQTFYQFHFESLGALSLQGEEKRKCRISALVSTRQTSLCSKWRISCSAKDMLTSGGEGFLTRSSANEVQQEMRKCYELIQKLGKGVVYLGSARTNPDHHHFLQAVELAKEVALLLDCTSWTGAGPGMMDAATKGTMEAEKPAGGFKVSNEGGKWINSNAHPYLDDYMCITCRFLLSRKHALVNAAVRDQISDQTAFIAFPGGIGTLDEIFEILALIQINHISSTYPIPFLLMNYDGFYSGLLEFLENCKLWGTISDGEVEALWKVCDNNAEALAYLADFYSIPRG